MIHSVADILGLNRVTRCILAQAAAAVVGMASVHNIQEDVPPENILAMADAAIELRVGAES